MNALGYALLSMLVRKSCTGYELKAMLDVFWQAKHSQIYPLLTRLLKDGLLTYERVEQSSKPDKKVYSITTKGLTVLQDWMSNAPNPPVIRDEFLIRVYAIWLVVERSVASSSYSFVHFLGGAFAPWLAGKLAEAYGADISF